MGDVQLFSSFDVNTVQSGSVRTLDNGAKIVYLSHGADMGSIVLQTQSLRTPKGVEKNEFGDSTKYTMELALQPDDPEYKKLQDFDNKIIELAMNPTKGERWIKSKTGASLSRDMLEELYTRALKIPRDKDGNISDRWPPTLKVTVPHMKESNTFAVEVWDSKREPVSPDDFVKKSRGATVTAIVRCTGVWVGGGKFGTTWKAQQIRVDLWGRGSIGSFAFIDTPQPAFRSVESAPSKKPKIAANEDDDYLEDSD